MLIIITEPYIRLNACFKSCYHFICWEPMKVITYDLEEASRSNDYEYVVRFKLGWLLLLSGGVIIIIFF